MKKRTAVIGALVSLLPMAQPLIFGTGAVLTSAPVIFSVPEKAKAESAVFFYNRGIDKYDRGDYYGAIADYTKAIEINPRFADAYYNRGNLKRDLEDYYGAIADYTKAIEINPRYVEAIENRGFAKSKLKDYEGACMDYRKALSLGSQRLKTWIRGESGAWCRNM